MIRRYFNYEKDISDGQCGLWGYKFGKLNINGCYKEIELTAEGYEIELDLLCEVLKNNLNYSFVDVELPENSKIKSSFVYTNNLTKIKFFLNKYKGLKENIPSYIKQFEDKNKESISKNKLFWYKYKKDLINLVNKFSQ